MLSTVVFVANGSLMMLAYCSVAIFD